ncbi:MAG: arginine--tRNA ligase [Bacteroidetes bacterium]|nr:arginine--tRNA ligase [Bacteroidota bacterium]
MFEKILAEKVCESINSLYQQTVSSDLVSVQKTRKEFIGDFTVVVFPFTKSSKKSPEITANEIGDFLKAELPIIKSFNVIKGFLNIEFHESEWVNFFFENKNSITYGTDENSGNSKPIVVEYSSPNTNKPLHLGHIRNNLLGYSVANILKANGQNVIKVNLVNDRGIHICKSMLAWQKWGEGESPESSGLKGDHLIGKYYVLFDKHYKEQIAELVSTGISEDDAKKQAALIVEAQEMLLKWEHHDEEVIALWKKMNAWVYQGFDVTYKRMGVDFDKVYYESETYLLGKSLVEEGLQKGTLNKKEDNSVWADLTADGFDEKLLLRSDGTSVYMTQDLGTAELRYDEMLPSKMIYVVGNEQNYHFDVLKLVLKKLGKDWFDAIQHLSYGMVELPEGKMKSREGTVVDADDLIDEMISTAKQTTEELGKTNDFSQAEADELYRMIGLGALKYFILKVDPTKNMVFNPKESIDFNGNTGPFIQYTYARIQSVLRKAEAQYNSEEVLDAKEIALLPKEKELLRLLYEFSQVVKIAGDILSPAIIANYVFELAKEYNQFYHEIPILKEPNLALLKFRLHLSAFTANVIKISVNLLGIEVPERM